MTNKAYRYEARTDLTILNIWQGDFEPPTDICNQEEIDAWANHAYYTALVDGYDEDEFVPDYDGTSRDSEGITIMIPSEAASQSIANLEAAGFLIENIGNPSPGHHGDGQWAGVELAEYQNGWIMLIN